MTLEENSFRRLRIGMLPVAFILLLAPNSCRHERDRAHIVWPVVTRESKPWTRWWWMGSAVDTVNINWMLEQYAEAGFGGMEITPIYGVMGMESRKIAFLSEGWLEMLDHTFTEAGKFNLGLDMNMGTGWPFGGPAITRDYAASRLVVKVFKVHEGQSLPKSLIGEEGGGLYRGAVPEAVMAYGPGGEVLSLSDRLDGNGMLSWRPERGNWDVYVAYCGKTGQLVKRAAPGGEGYSLDHFSREGVEAYLDHFGQAFTSSRGIRAFFNDSYEVYNASWTPGLFDYFQQRRGYDLQTHLRELVSGDQSDLTARIKCDYRETLAELLLENFTRAWTEWSHQRGVLTRNQAHGSPANLIDLYTAVDIPECETYGHTRYRISGLRQDTSDRINVEPDPIMLQLATSAAHISGRKLISNETFTWLGEHFRVPLAQCKPEAEEAFLAGINHIFYHGTTYSPREESWPGWLFYASMNFAPSNSFWPHLKGLNNYITLCQSLLQSGKPDNDLLVYWPVYDIWSDPEGLELQLSVHNIREWLNYPDLNRLKESGYTFDFISDQWLDRSSCKAGSIITSREAIPYTALVIPECRTMPLETLRKILQLAKDGAYVIFKQLPADVPGLVDLEVRQKAMAELLDGLDFETNAAGIAEAHPGKGVILISPDLNRAMVHAGIHSERFCDYGIKYTRRTIDDGTLYFLVNHTRARIDTILPLSPGSRKVLILDPQHGTHGVAQVSNSGNQTLCRVRLESGESLFLRTYSRHQPACDDWLYFRPSGPPLDLSANWALRFTEGGPQLPMPVQMDTLMAYTEMGDSLAQYFSGSAIYSTTFDLHSLAADDYLLDLGRVYESARVWLNGEELGILYCNPFQARVGHLLKTGRNELEIEVTNLMANRIRYLEKHAVPWKRFQDINFVDIHYQPFDASGWEPVRSGLDGPVRLIPLEVTN
jgi:hypothetical protein